jgi:hypothetical protein
MRLTGRRADLGEVIRVIVAFVREVMPWETRAEPWVEEEWRGEWSRDERMRDGKHSEVR